MPLQDSSSSPPQPGGDDGVDQYIRLGNRLASLGLFKDALDLFDAAIRHHPGNIELTVSQAQVLEHKQEHERELLAGYQESLRWKLRQQSRLASQSLGLGEMYLERGDSESARRCFEAALAANSSWHTPAARLARLAFDAGDAKGAIDYFERARGANPFDRETSELLGDLYADGGEPERALHAYIDAMLLSGVTAVERSELYRDRIRRLQQQLGDALPSDLGTVIRLREARLQGLIKRLQRARQSEIEVDDEDAAAEAAEKADQAVREERQARVRRSRLRHFPIFDDLDDEDLEAVADRLTVRALKDSDVVFAEGDTASCLHLISRGTVEIRKITSLGQQTMHTLGEGEVFGRINFLDGRPHMMHAICGSDAELYLLHRDAAEDLLNDRRNVAVSFLVYFWRTLARNIRESNRKMNALVFDGMSRRVDPARRAEARKLIQENNRRLAEFKQVGLSGRDIEILAAQAEERFFAKDELIFREGDEGAELFIIADGRVRIARAVDDDAAKTLAVLDRGEVFGEMAIVDDQKRSASAFAAEPRTRVIVVPRQRVEEILSDDTALAQPFLSLICRILAKRLQEIDLTIIRWRILAGFA